MDGSAHCALSSGQNIRVSSVDDNSRKEGLSLMSFIFDNALEIPPNSTALSIENERIFIVFLRSNRNNITCYCMAFCDNFVQISKTEREEAIGGDDARAAADVAAEIDVAHARRFARIRLASEAHHEDLLRTRTGDLLIYF